MFGVFYMCLWFFNFVKDTFKDSVEDVRGQVNRHINERIYINNITPTDIETGHPVVCCGDHKYQDLITRQCFRTAITAADIKIEEAEKENAKQWGNVVYKISGARLPLNVEGQGYKDFNSDRIYVARYIRKTLTNRNYNIKNGVFLVSINSDNYGRVERFFGGRPLTEPYITAFEKLYIDPNSKNGNNTMFVWKI